MSSAASIEYPVRHFTCRHCGREASVESCLARTLAEFAAKVGMKNTRWGTQCVEDCR